MATKDRNHKRGAGFVVMGITLIFLSSRFHYSYRILVSQVTWGKWNSMLDTRLPLFNLDMRCVHMELGESG